MNRSLSIILIAFLTGCVGNSGNKISLPFTASKWEIRSGIYEKKPIILQINRALDKFIGSLNYQAAASVSIKKPLADGLPDENETASLKKIETLLTEKLDKAGLAVFALEVTSDKTCDLIFYTNNKKAVQNVFSDIGKMFDDYQIAFTVKRDKGWMNYKWFLSYVNTGIWGGL
jgi:hypothetical protein